MSSHALLFFLGYLGTGFLSGLLAGLFGLGGGIVVVPALIFLFGQLGVASDWITHLAVGTSLTTILGTGTASVLAHHRRNAVRWDLFRKLAGWMLVGGWLGASIAGFLPRDWLQRLFGGFLIFVGIRMLQASGGMIQRVRPVAGWMGLGIGSLSALVGIGGGTLTVPLLARAGVPLPKAVGTASACGLPIALSGALGFLLSGWGQADLPSGSTGFIYWPGVLGILLSSLPSASLGARLAHQLPLHWLRRLFALLLFTVALRLLY